MESHPTGDKFEICDITARKSLPSATSFVIDTKHDTMYFLVGDKKLYKSHVLQGVSSINIGTWKVTAGLTFDGQDHLYFASDEIILKYHIPSDTVSIFKQDFVLKRLVTSPKHAFVKALSMDTKGGLYALMDDGIYYFWMFNGKVEHKRITDRGYERQVPLYTPQAESMLIFHDAIYFTDRDANCIRKYRDGKFEQIGGVHLYAPLSIAMTNDGNLLVVEWSGIKHIDLKTHKVLPFMLTCAATRIRSVATDAEGKIWLGGTSVHKIKPLWYWERFLWIAKLKEDPSNCNLAQLPKEIIKEVARSMHLRPVKA